MYSCYRTDHRKFKRYRVNLSVVIEILGPEHVMKIFKVLGHCELEAKVVDISALGVGLLCGQYIPAGSLMSMKFVIFESNAHGHLDTHEVLKVQGQLVHVKYSGDCVYRFGVQYLPLTSDQKKCLEDITASCLQKSSDVELTASEFLQMNS